MKEGEEGSEGESDGRREVERARERDGGDRASIAPHTHSLSSRSLFR
jgi:hypothetical protein